MKYVLRFIDCICLSTVETFFKRSISVIRLPKNCRYITVALLTLLPLISVAKKISEKDLQR